MMYLFLSFGGRERLIRNIDKKLQIFIILIKEGEGRRECIVTKFLFNDGFVDFLIDSKGPTLSKFIFYM